MDAVYRVWLSILNAEREAHFEDLFPPTVKGLTGYRKAHILHCLYFIVAKSTNDSASNVWGYEYH